MLTIEEPTQIEIRDVKGDMNDDTIRGFIEYAYTGNCIYQNSDDVQLPADSKELQELSKSISSLRCDEHEWAVPL